jgi:hypothetical protein
MGKKVYNIGPRLRNRTSTGQIKIDENRRDGERGAEKRERSDGRRTDRSRINFGRRDERRRQTSML